MDLRSKVDPATGSQHVKQRMPQFASSLPSKWGPRVRSHCCGAGQAKKRIADRGPSEEKDSRRGGGGGGGGGGPPPSIPTLLWRNYQNAHLISTQYSSFLPRFSLLDNPYPHLIDTLRQQRPHGRQAICAAAAIFGSTMPIGSLRL
ncbi:hypothetical protein ACLOJK_040428 [Asimina triloba]